MTLQTATNEHRSDDGQLVPTIGARLRARRDELEPLVAEYDRVQRVADAVGDAPVVHGESDAVGDVAEQHAAVVRHLEEVRKGLLDLSRRLAPLIYEYEQILHVLPAFESAEALSLDSAGERARARRARSAPGRRNGGSATGEARLEQVKELLTQPRARAELAELMGLSPSRVTELLDRLANAGEITQVRDETHPSRKLWTLAKKDSSDDAGAQGQ
jgi:hypothetical protein